MALSEPTTAEDVRSGASAAADPLMSDEPTIELVSRAREGDMPAMEALLQRCLPPLKRWAHGRLPPAARGPPRHGRSRAGSRSARARQSRDVRAAPCRGDAGLSAAVGHQPYLRRSAAYRPAAAPCWNCPPTIRPIARHRRRKRFARRRTSTIAMRVSRLTPKDRAIIVARIEMQWSLAEIAHRHGLPTVDAARMAVNRAVKRLSIDFAARRKQR